MSALRERGDVARGRVVIGRGQAVAVLEVAVGFRPRRCAYSFIICANAASVPPTRSASAMVASLPDCTIIPFRRISTGICVPTCTKVREPSARQACSLIVTMSVSFRRPSSSAVNTTYAVMSLVRLAGSERSSACCWARTRPL